jgi:initiation factor 1A
MPKNKGGGSYHKRQASKHSQPVVQKKLRLQHEDGEIYAKVIKLLGQGRAHVICIDGITRLLEIRKKFKGRNKRDNLIDVDTIVLVGKRDWEYRTGDKLEKVDLLYVYSLYQHLELIKNANISSFFNKPQKKGCLETNECDDNDNMPDVFNWDAI